jgi:hypothetical protein
MSRLIYKFVFTPLTHSIQVPEGAVPLTAREQRGQLVLWAEVDPGARYIDREIMVVGTGHPLPPVDFVYLDTILRLDGDLVLHVYVRAET